MAELITLSLAISLIIFCEHLSPVTADFYLETLRKSKTEPGKLFKCLVKEVPMTPPLVLSPTSWKNLLELRRQGLAAGPPEDDEYPDDDSPPNTQAVNLSYMPFEEEDEDEDPDDTQSRATLQTRGLTMRRIKESLRARTLFTLGRRKSPKSRKSSKRSRGSFLSKATFMSKSSTKGKSNRNHPSLSLGEIDTKYSPEGDDLPPAARKARSFSCVHVWSVEEIAEVHARVNFYLVAYPKLPGDHIINLPDMNTPSIFLLGVPLLEEEPDWPAFIDGHREDVAMVVALVRQMLVNLVQPPFLKGLSVDSIAAFMSTANFRHFSRPVPKMVNRYKSFAELQGNVEEYCGTKRTSTNHIIPPENPKKLEAAESAIRLLVQKMIDPCFMGAEGRRKDPQGVKDADSLCKEHCKFLAVSFAVFPNAIDEPEGCSSAIVSGHCDRKPRVCKCKQVSGSGGDYGSSKSLLVPMIQCCNLLRRNILPPISVAESHKGPGKVPTKWV